MIFGSVGIDELPVGHPPQQLLEHHPDLEPRQVRAEAEVRAEPERDVPVVASRDVEHVGIVERPRIAVRRRVQQEQLVAFADLLGRGARGRRWRSGAC